MAREYEWRKALDTGEKCVRFFVVADNDRPIVAGAYNNDRPLSDEDGKAIVLSTEEDIRALMASEVIGRLADPESMRIVGIGQVSWEQFQKDNAGMYREYDLPTAREAMRLRIAKALERKKHKKVP